MRVNLIHNPVAGQNAQSDAELLTDLIRRAGHEVTYQTSADVHWSASIDVPCDLIAVAGGDGTSGRIAKRLVGRDIPMTFIPMGTANNISKTLGLSRLSIEELIDGWSRPRSLPIDVGVIDSPWGSSYFIEGVGIGLFVSTMIEIDEAHALSHLDTSSQKILQAMRILGQRLKSFPVCQLGLTLDGKDLSGAYIMLEVMNMRFVGPNLHLAPASDPADGLLDVVLVSEHERDELQQYLSHATHEGFDAPVLPIYRGKHLRIEGQVDVLHVDDEAWPAADVRHHSVSGPIDISARDHAIEVLVPSLSR